MKNHTAEDLIGTSDANLADLIAKNADGIVVVDQEGIIRYANPATEKLFQRPLSELVGEPFGFQIVSGESAEVEIRRGDNQVAVVDMRVVDIAWGGRQGQLVSLREVTQERQRQAHLQQRERLATVGQLAAGIAHDFNNILAPILLYADLIQRNFIATDPNYNHVEEIRRSGRRARDLIAQIMAFSRQGIPQTREAVHLQPILREVLHLVRAVLPVTVEVQLEIDAQVGPVIANSTQIHQVLMNLCVNAEHAMRKQGGGILKVCLDTIAIDERLAIIRPALREGRYARLRVQDTGHGMDQATMARVFEPFFTTKGVGEGTGMGLSTVYGIVMDSGGDIAVESTVGKGTTFTVYLPQVEASTPAYADSEGIDVEGTEHILVVDDESAITYAAQVLLQTMGYHVTAMTDSQEALAIYRANPEQFDLAILDLTMPKHSGIDLSRTMTELQPGLPIILISGNLASITPELMQEAGISRTLAKPFTSAELSHLIRELLDQRAITEVQNSGRAVTIHHE